MKKMSALLLLALGACLLTFSASAQKPAVTEKTVNASARRTYKPIAIENSPALQTLLSAAVASALNEKFKDKKIRSDEIAATLIDLHNAEHPQMANFNGDLKLYPASVVKLFYLAAIKQWVADGKIRMTAELERGLKDMIVDSSNDATQYILDVLTDTASGGELPAKEFAEWSYKRNAVNRFYQSLGYDRINVNQKTYCEDAYGREQQFRNYRGENRNMLTTNATARLLAEIAAGRMVSPEKSTEMMNLLKRDPFAGSKDGEDQAHDFTGIALIERKLRDAKLWSKAGWTSKSRHDAAYIETPDGNRLVLVIFTENAADDRRIIPDIAGYILDNFGKIKN